MKVAKMCKMQRNSEQYTCFTSLCVKLCLNQELCFTLFDEWHVLGSLSCWVYLLNDGMFYFYVWQGILHFLHFLAKTKNSTSVAFIKSSLVGFIKCGEFSEILQFWFSGAILNVE